MNFRTPVELPESSLQLLPQSRVLFIGSCFADHVGQRLAACLPSNQVCINPHGTLYNPVSIRNVLATYLADDVVKPFSEAGFFQLDSDEWRHWDYATKYTASSRAALATMLREEWQLTADLCGAPMHYSSRLVPTMYIVCAKANIVMLAWPTVTSSRCVSSVKKWQIGIHCVHSGQRFFSLSS